MLTFPWSSFCSASSSPHVIFQPSLPLFHSWGYHFQYLPCFFTLSLPGSLVWLYFQRAFQLIPLPVPASFSKVTLCLLCFSSCLSPFLPGTSFQSSLTRSNFYPLLVYQIPCLCQTPFSVSNQTMALASFQFSLDLLCIN